MINAHEGDGADDADAAPARWSGLARNGGDWWRARWFLVALSAALPAIALFAFARQVGLHVALPGSWLVFLLLTPLLEELVFRGLLQGALLRWRRLAAARLGISGANALTSLAFASAHLWREPWPWAAATLLPALIFGIARERSGGVVAPCVLHAAYNAAMGLGLWLGSSWG